MFYHLASRLQFGLEKAEHVTSHVPTTRSVQHRGHKRRELMSTESVPRRSQDDNERRRKTRRIEKRSSKHRASEDDLPERPSAQKDMPSSGGPTPTFMTPFLSGPPPETMFQSRAKEATSQTGKRFGTTEKDKKKEKEKRKDLWEESGKIDLLSRNKSKHKEASSSKQKSMSTAELLTAADANKLNLSPAKLEKAEQKEDISTPSASAIAEAKAEMEAEKASKAKKEESSLKGGAQSSQAQKKQSERKPAGTKSITITSKGTSKDPEDDPIRSLFW
ncbi:unnamed protein product [Cyprideis torosa]|uniref:Uncharacterized protein n=1 Tax=Cyprideis torosa TaxID=163714 RepID=A0A7R8W6D9_9CRUS|nr:unnamed protein product [Cyprideis torosa]CAG0886411.1 unnamed protein product [Cyprideis torosa]